MSASATRGTLKVDVSRMGISISPSSFTWVEPASLPKALPTKTARYLFAEHVSGMWQDGGHARAHIAATDDGLLPDLNASNIGDRIERPSRQDADLEPQVRGTRPCIGSCVLRDSDGGHEHGYEIFFRHVGSNCLNRLCDAPAPIPASGYSDSRAREL